MFNLRGDRRLCYIEPAGPGEVVVKFAAEKPQRVRIGRTWITCSCEPANDSTQCKHKRAVRAFGLVAQARRLKLVREGVARA